MRVYIAGPMTGYKEFNFPAFLAAAKALRGQGYEVFCPAEHDLENGFDPAGMAGKVGEMEETGFSIRMAMKDDLSWITTYADAVIVLPNWWLSRGANAEKATADAIDIPVYTFADFVLQGEDATRLP